MLFMCPNGVEKCVWGGGGHTCIIHIVHTCDLGYGLWIRAWIMDLGFGGWGGVGLATPSFSLHLRERVKSMDKNKKAV
jgi:hypothetical protein